jgi:hypothetical protein
MELSSGGAMLPCFFIPFMFLVLGFVHLRPGC